MKMQKESLVLLMADDDEDDCLLLGSAFNDAEITGEMLFVGDGRELLEYLQHEGEYSGPEKAPRPDLILLDLNMPRKDGREALKEIKANPQLKNIPVVILTTTKEERDIDYCYRTGACAFITKPVAYEDSIKMLQSIIEKLRTDSLRPTDLGSFNEAGKYKLLIF
ncbi:Response regulator receiver protein [Syntrophobacter sp. SbD1]|nr:Response regulator receiver protein [Syntrophobacter sp. SbD1]